MNAQYFTEISIGNPPQSVCMSYLFDLFIGLDLCFQRLVQGHSGHWVRNQDGYIALILTAILQFEQFMGPEREMYLNCMLFTYQV